MDTAAVSVYGTMLAHSRRSSASSARRRIRDAADKSRPWAHGGVAALALTRTVLGRQASATAVPSPKGRVWPLCPTLLVLVVASKSRVHVVPCRGPSLCMYLPKCMHLPIHNR